MNFTGLKIMKHEKKKNHYKMADSNENVFEDKELGLIVFAVVVIHSEGTEEKNFIA